MKRKFVGFAMLAAVLAAAPAFAQSVDEKINALEQELTQLKEQQIELKKEATEAAAAMPTFSYRPGNGLTIEAADKAWSFRTSMEAHIRWIFESGRDQVGRTNGEIMGRRFRPSFFFCVNNCLWEIETALDLDGFGTGNAKNSLGDSVGSILQRGAVYFHAENLNPWLPTLSAGMDISTSTASVARQGSSGTGSQREYDINSRNNGGNTGSAGNGFALTWDDRSLSGIGIPGRISRFQVAMANVGEGGDGLSSFTDRKDFTAYLGIDPFSQVKNKWLSGLRLDIGAWFCNVDARTGGATDNGCARMRLQDHGDAAAQTLFTTGNNAIGDGLYRWLSPGVTWNVGPYTLRAMGGFARAEDRGGTRGKKQANNFLIGHDLYVWSPKGFLTGSANTPGSILFGTHFERNDISVGCNGSTGITCPGSLNGGQFHRNTVLLREWDLWYVIMPRMSVGLSILWYDASNLRNGANQAAHNLGVCNTPRVTNATGCRNGIGGDWVDGSLTWRYTF